MRGAPGWNSGGDDGDATLLILGVEVARLQRHRMPVKTMKVGNEDMF